MLPTAAAPSAAMMVVSALIAESRPSLKNKMHDHPSMILNNKFGTGLIKLRIMVSFVSKTVLRSSLVVARCCFCSSLVGRREVNADGHRQPPAGTSAYATSWRPRASSFRKRARARKACSRSSARRSRLRTNMP